MLTSNAIARTCVLPPNRATPMHIKEPGEVKTWFQVNVRVPTQPCVWIWWCARMLCPLLIDHPSWIGDVVGRAASMVIERVTVPTRTEFETPREERA